MGIEDLSIIESQWRVRLSEDPAPELFDGIGARLSQYYCGADIERESVNRDFVELQSSLDALSSSNTNNAEESSHISSDISEVAKKSGDEFGYENTCFLVLFGHYPNSVESKIFKEIISKEYDLPEGFLENIILCCSPQGYQLCR